VNIDRGRVWTVRMRDMVEDDVRLRVTSESPVVGFVFLWDFVELDFASTSLIHTGGKLKWTSWN
jgi:hypothetical protein